MPMGVWLISMCLTQMCLLRRPVGSSWISLLCRLDFDLDLDRFTCTSLQEMKCGFKRKDDGGSRSPRVPTASNTGITGWNEGEHIVWVNVYLGLMWSLGVL